MTIAVLLYLHPLLLPEKLQPQLLNQRLNLTGNLKKTPAGCDVLFESGRFFEFLKSALKYVAKQSGTSDTFTSMTT